MSRERRSHRPGFTLAEMLVALTISSFLFAAIMGVVVSVQKTQRTQRDAVRSEDALRAAERVITTALRTAGADPERKDLGVIDPDPLAHGPFDNLRVVADFNPVDGDVGDLLEDILLYVEDDTLFVRWQAGAQHTAAAFPIRSLAFEYQDRNQNALTTTADVQSRAARVRFTLTTPPDPVSGIAREATSWVFLRNRSRK